MTHETGAVAQPSREIAAEDELTGAKNSPAGWIQSSTNLRSGDRAALVNSAGEVVGMNAAATLNFTIDGDSDAGRGGDRHPDQPGARHRQPDPRRCGQPGRATSGPSAMLGIGIAATGASEPGGLRVRSVLQGGPAGLAGVRPGDVITVIDGVPTTPQRADRSADQLYPATSST